MGQVVEVEIDTKNKGSKRYRGHRVERYMDNSKNREPIKKENIYCCCWDRNKHLMTGIIINHALICSIVLANS